MTRRVANLSLDNLDDLPRRCRACVYWELDPLARARAEEAGDTDFEKEAWASATLLEWGTCGKVLYLDGEPAGYLVYAPPWLVPRAAAFPTSPVSPDAVVLTTLRVSAKFRGAGMGRLLVQALARDLVRRGVRAVEAFADSAGVAEDCLLPAGFLLAVGFKTVRPHHRNPRLRLDLRSVAMWREDFETALERLVSAVRVDGVLHPA